MLGLFGNSHWSAKGINLKQCLKLTNLCEEAMTVEWASISFEQRMWQHSHLIVVLSGPEKLIALLSGNSGFMVTDDLRRFAVDGPMPDIDALMVQPIEDAEELL